MSRRSGVQAAPTASQARRAERRERAERPMRMPWPAAVALLAGAALLAFAPPDTDLAWAINGLRSLPLPASLGIAVAAAALGFVASRRWRGAFVWWAIAVPLAIVVAFPLRESLHFLGDTQTRLRAMAAFTGDIVPATLSDWVQRLHASPLDVAIDVFVPMLLGRVGMQLPDAVSLVGLLLALAYFAIAWRVSRVVGTPDSSRIGVTLAIVLTGMLLAFAGYAESGGLLAVTALLWWSRVLAPLARPRDAVWLGVAWLLVLLSHRLGLVLLLPMLLRAFGPPIEGDRPMPRSLLTGLLVVIGVLGFAALLVGGGAVQLGRDARELLGTARSGGFRIAAPSDIVNTLWLVAPLALIDVPLAGWPAWLGFLRTPAARLATITAIPLVIGLVWLFPLGPSGLGAHRDWDANILLGVTLTVAAAQVLALAPPARLRAVVPWTVVLLALSALSWLAVNANQETSVSRALAVANRTSLPEAQRSHAYLFLGQRAMDVGDPAAAGAFYDRSFELNPNPRRALLAAEAWTVAGDPNAARRSLGQARSRELNPTLVTAAGSIEGAIGRLEAAIRADSAAADSSRRDSTR